MKNTIIKIALFVSRILFGFTFLFSGFVKAVDPMGSAYKFIDYFRAFDLKFLNDTALPLAILLAAVEFTIGACILFGSYRRLSTWCGLLFMCFFTPLTLYLALENPVSDCGCFGDAFVMTNWETFYKNIALLIFAIILFWKRAEIKPLFTINLRWIPALYAMAFSIGISVVGIQDLPILDFRPYKNGVNIQQAMQTPEGAPAPEYRLVYEKDGVKKEFTLENYPDDTTWIFVETKTILPEAKWQAPIKDFFLTDEEGNNITNTILDQEGYTFLLISPDLATADENYIDRINEVYDYAIDHDYGFYCVTVNDENRINDWTERTGAEYSYIFSDVTIIETIVRANPGLILLNEGTIIWKKSPRNFPTEEMLKEPLTESKLGEAKKNNSQTVILYCILVFFAPILVLLFFEKTIITFVEKRKKVKTA